MARVIQPSTEDIRRYLLWADKRRTGETRSLAEIAANFGAKRNRRGGYSKRAYAIYAKAGSLLQRMKRAGDVEHVGGGGAGWRLTRKERTGG